MTFTESGRELRFGSDAIPCMSLSLAVAGKEPTDESELLVVNTRSGLVAITVSESVDRRRMAVRNLGPILDGADHITGAALMGGGKALAVLDPNFLGVVASTAPPTIRSQAEDPRHGRLRRDQPAPDGHTERRGLRGRGGPRYPQATVATIGFDAMVVDCSTSRSNGVAHMKAIRTSDLAMVPSVPSRDEMRASDRYGGRVPETTAEPSLPGPALR